MTCSDQHGRLHPLSKTRHLSTETTLVSLFRHPDTIKMTRSDQHGHLHPMSKMRRLLIETTLVSPFRHPETIKSDGTQRPTWSSAPFVKGTTFINRDYFSLSFSSSRDNQVR